MSSVKNSLGKVGNNVVQVNSGATGGNTAAPATTQAAAGGKTAVPVTTQAPLNPGQMDDAETPPLPPLGSKQDNSSLFAQLDKPKSGENILGKARAQNNGAIKFQADIVLNTVSTLLIELQNGRFDRVKDEQTNAANRQELTEKLANIADELKGVSDPKVRAYYVLARALTHLMLARTYDPNGRDLTKRDRYIQNFFDDMSENYPNTPKNYIDGIAGSFKGEGSAALKSMTGRSLFSPAELKTIVTKSYFLGVIGFLRAAKLHEELKRGISRVQGKNSVDVLKSCEDTFFKPEEYTNQNFSGNAGGSVGRQNKIDFMGYIIGDPENSKNFIGLFLDTVKLYAIHLRKHANEAQIDTSNRAKNSKNSKDAVADFIKMDEQQTLDEQGVHIKKVYNFLKQFVETASIPAAKKEEFRKQLELIREFAEPVAKKKN